MTPTMPADIPEIQGWFDFQQMYWKVANALPNGAIIVELGPWMGKSTLFLAQSLVVLNKPNCIIYAVDTWKGSPNEQAIFDYVLASSPISGKTRFERTMEKYGVTEMVKAVEMDSLSAAHLREDRSVDFVFFDTEHTEEHLSLELKYWIPKLKPNALFAGHDIAIPGVRRAVEKHVKNWKEVGPCWEAIND